MKHFFTIILAVSLCLYLSCTKSSVPPTETGTINGAPALTLYGNSGAPADYMFLSTSQKKISYSGLILPYVYTTGNVIVLINGGYSVARCTLDTTALKTTLTVDSSYGLTFGSTLYKAN